MPSRMVGVAGTLSLIPESAPSTWVLGRRGGGGVRTARKLKNALQIITNPFNDPLRDKIRSGPQLGPVATCMHVLFSVSLGKFFVVSRVQKKLSCRVIVFFLRKLCTKNCQAM